MGIENYTSSRKHGRNPCNHGVNKDPLNRKQKNQAREEKSDELDSLVKLEYFVLPKKLLQKLKGKHKCQKIFTTHVSDKALIFTYMKTLIT